MSCCRLDWVSLGCNFYLFVGPILWKMARDFYWKWKAKSGCVWVGLWQCLKILMHLLQIRTTFGGREGSDYAPWLVNYGFQRPQFCAFCRPTRALLQTCNKPFARWFPLSLRLFIFYPPTIFICRHSIDRAFEFVVGDKGSLILFIYFFVKVRWYWFEAWCKSMFVGCMVFLLQNSTHFWEVARETYRYFYLGAGLEIINNVH